MIGSMSHRWVRYLLICLCRLSLVSLLSKCTLECFVNYIVWYFVLIGLEFQPPKVLSSLKNAILVQLWILANNNISVAFKILQNTNTCWTSSQIRNATSPTLLAHCNKHTLNIKSWFVHAIGSIENCNIWACIYFPDPDPLINRGNMNISWNNQVNLSDELIWSERLMIALFFFKMDSHICFALLFILSYSEISLACSL